MGTSSTSRPAETTYDVVIVGAGHNGLVCAFYLAAAGRRICVLERRSIVGGACVSEPLLGDATFSTCANMIWRLERRVVEDMELERRGFAYASIDPLAVHLFEDGRLLRTRRDAEATRHEVERLAPEDAAHYADWCSYWERATAILRPFMLHDPPSDAQLRRHAEQLGELDLYLDLKRSSVIEVCERHFGDPRVAAAVLPCHDFDPTAPGTAWVHAWIGSADPGDVGDAFVIGGSGTVTTAMARAVQARGGEVVVDAEVAEILVDAGQVSGVRLATGEVVRAGIVVSGADPKRTFTQLVAREAVSGEFRHQVEELGTGVGCLKFHSLASELPDLSGYVDASASPYDCGILKIAQSPDQLIDAVRAALRGDVPREPVIGAMMIPTIYDPELAPAGLHTISIWVPFMPAHPNAGPWSEIRDAVAERVLDVVDAHVPNFRRSLVDWLVLTPADLEERVALTDGCIHHLALNPEQFLDRRPLLGLDYGTPVPGLYLCGAGTHPGGEVSGAPGFNAAHAILDE
jgi:phytoene dehydrogenase-like protein